MKPVKGSRVLVEHLEISCHDCAPNWVASTSERTLDDDLRVGMNSYSDVVVTTPDGKRWPPRRLRASEVLSVRQLSDSVYGVRARSTIHTLGCPQSVLPIYWTSRMTVLSEPS